MLLSICAVVLALGLGGLQQADQPGQSDGREAARDTQAVPPVVPPPQPSADIEDPGCERGQDNRASDLCAQWKAADAARSSANAAWWLGFLGLCIGIATLWAASRAAHWAKEAAKHTEASAKAGAAQVTSYPVIKEAILIYEHDRHNIRFGIKNFGATPALGVRIDIRVAVQQGMELTYVDEEMSNNGEPADDGWGAAISPNEVHGIQWLLPEGVTTSLQNLGPNDGPVSVLLDTRLKALDVLGKPFVKIEHWALHVAVITPVIVGRLDRTPMNLIIEMHDLKKKGLLAG